MDKLVKERIRRLAKKIKAVNLLGGKCVKCNEDDIFLLTFHHTQSIDKEYTISRILYARWSIIKEELKKCILLCNNCHAEHHYNENTSIIDKYTLNKRNSKMIYLEYSNSKCNRCEYDKCPASLTFHHLNPNDKLFMLGNKHPSMKNLNDLSTTIRNEIDKCELLCINCHSREHADYIFLKEYQKEINNKINNYKETQTKLDRSLIITMYNNGAKQIDIAKHFNASKGTICDIIKKHNQ